MLATVKLFFLKCNLSPPPSKLVEDKLVLILLIYYYTSMSHFNLLLSSLWFSTRLACLQWWKKKCTGMADWACSVFLSLLLFFFNFLSGLFIPPVYWNSSQFSIWIWELVPAETIYNSCEEMLLFQSALCVLFCFYFLFYFLSSTNRQ